MGECDKTIECDVEVDKILSTNEKTESINYQNQTSKSTSRSTDGNQDLVRVNNASRTSVKPGDSVVALGFADKSNEIYVQRLEDADKVEEVGNVLKSKCAKSLGSVPRAGELVACKWSEDGEIYRAEVLEVLNENEIKVHFVDYGNAEKEVMNNVMKLPIEAASFPFLASLLTLEGVTSYDKVGNPSLSDLLQEVEGRLLEDILEVASLADGKYVLKHENGKILNDTIEKELKKESKKEITSDQNKVELAKKLEQEASLQKVEEDKRKELEDQIRKMQEMLAQMK